MFNYRPGGNDPSYGKAKKVIPSTQSKYASNVAQINLNKNKPSQMGMQSFRNRKPSSIESGGAIDRIEDDMMGEDLEEMHQDFDEGKSGI